MAQFFIDHPVFAWVLAILITLGGGMAVVNLPIESYPAIAPPQVNISASYRGADASTVETTVTQIIEQQLTGLDGMLYFTSTSSSDGSSRIVVTFETGTDPDIAAVQTQNRVQLAQSRLPTEVIQQGVNVSKSTAGFMMAVSVRSPDRSVDAGTLNNLIAAQVLDQVQRIPGVGSASQFGAEYAMRIWLDPHRLHAYGLAPTRVLEMLRDQNVQFAAGSLGADPAVPGQQVSAPVVAEGRFTSIDQFENVILRAEEGGSTVRLKDVARVALGPSAYGFDLRLNDEPVAGFGVQLLPGANALDVAEAVKAKMAELQATFPAGVEWFVPFDATNFIKISIEEVLKTLGAAIVLVFIVMLVFLQSLRATLIPTLVVPAALMGAFIGMYAFGFSINQLTLFGMVLAIGIVVDDAIVVIEAVERIMREEGLSPREATRKAMGQITGAIVTITVVLTAVFVPSALLGGATGAIYRQFALTIAVSMLFSAFLALSFTPALCASFLRPTHMQENLLFRWFNRTYDRSQRAYLRVLSGSVRHAPRWMGAFAVMVVLGGVLFYKLPSSFVPQEDQGFIIGIVQLPAGSSLSRTKDVMTRMGAVLRRNEAVDSVFQVGGFSFIGQGENVGLMFVRLKPWDERKASSFELNQWANMNLFMEIKDATAFVFNLPTIPGLGAFGGFEFWLEDRAGKGHDALMEAQRALLGAAAQTPRVSNVSSNTLADAPRLKMTVDRVQAQSMGLDVSDVYGAVQMMLAPVYANDFFYEGRVLRVLMQADAPYRMNPSALSRIYVPSQNATSASDAAMASNGVAASNGDSTSSGRRMIPLASVVQADWTIGPPSVSRYNGYPAVQVTGQPGAGSSSGEAMQAMENMVRTKLPPGFGFDWAGQSLQELLSGAQAPMLFLLSILVVYLCLAALYESWVTPAAVMLIVPLGVLGAVVTVWLHNSPNLIFGQPIVQALSNDIFFKIGIITIIGLAAKNAILIVEFAVSEQSSGRSLYDSVIEAARLRLRPILMTSFAFILGVMPLAISTGAGANARRAIGTGVVGGMLSAAILGVLLVPVFYVVVRRLMGDALERAHGT